MLATCIITFILASTLFINVSNASNQITYTLQSNGAIISEKEENELIVILRNTCIFGGSQESIIEKVDNFVENHPYITAVTISDMHQYGVWWYGFSFSKTEGTWMGVTFTQLKTMIDRFHHYGWKVGLETTGIAWNGQQEYNYITNEHPELAFTDANGLRATGIDNITALTKNPGYNKVIPNFFAKFATDDPINNISAGSRLIDIYTERLTNMIKDGLDWDFWFGTDGWNGVSNQGYYWNSATANKCYGFSVEEQNEFGNWSKAILPINWDNMNQTQKAYATISNQTILNNWWYYWQIRFAQMYAQIKQAFIDAGQTADTFHTIGSADISSAPGNPGYLCAAGMYNMSLLAEYNSIDYFYVDQEWANPAGTLGQNQAYVGAVVKMQNPELNPIIGLQPQDWKGVQYNLDILKQEYLAQAVNYVWYNGLRFRVSQPNVIMLQYSYGNLTRNEISELFNFIQTTVNLLSQSQPLWLGPVYATPNAISFMGNAWYQMNYSFAQWAWTANLQKNPDYINSEMGTVLMDEALQDSGPNLEGLNDRMINLWENGELNIWYWENSGRDWGMSCVWAPSSTPYVSSIEEQISNTFHITRLYGNSNIYTVLTQAQNSEASKITSGYEATKYYLGSSTAYVHGVYVADPSFTTLASFTDDNPDRVAIGYYKNKTSSNFLLTHMANMLPKALVNRMLYTMCGSPINSTESLVDLKILSSYGDYIIPMTNMRDFTTTTAPMTNLKISTTLSIDAVTLGLGDPSSYNVYWANSNEKVSVTSWKSIPIELVGMADLLVISLLNVT